MRTKHFHKIFKTRTKLKIWLCLIFVFIITILLFFNYCVNPVIIDVSEATVKSLTSKSVNSAVQTVINNTDVYDDIIKITTDSEGNIVNFQVQSLVINKLGKEIGKVAQQNLELVGSEGIGVPIGTLTGIPILVGKGPEINFRVQPIGYITSNFFSEFTSAGINQTNHRIYMNLQATVTVVLPTATKNISTNTQMLICESIIIGKVPDTYLNSTNLDEMMNLIPS